MSQLPLGRKESSRLEFKSKDSLKKPFGISREIGAMLNAEGGEIWIGLREHEGTAVEIECIDDPDRARGALLDHVMNVLEPAPDDRSVRIEIVRPSTACSILCIQVTPQDERGSYAVLKDGGRLFQKRIGDRTRPMHRDEIVIPRAGASKAVSQDDRTRSRLERARQILIETGAPGMWLGLDVSPNVVIDLTAVRSGHLLRDPGVTGNRDAGWNFVNRHREPQRKGQRIVSGDPEIPELSAYSDGRLARFVPLDRLQWMGETTTLWPYALAEYPVSIFRLAKVLYEMPSPPRTVFADFGLKGIAKWGLRPYSPDAFDYKIEPARIYGEINDGLEDFLLPRPISFDWNELRANPDQGALRIVEAVYNDFGYERTEMPREIDWKTMMLNMPKR